jgi:PAS domain S-box-containing protein
MAKSGQGRVDFYSEALDIVQFSSERYQRIFRNYLHEKYAENPPDLLLFIYVGNLGIAAALLKELFPSVPVVVIGLTEEKVATDQLGSLVSGFAQQVDPRTTMELILRLQPETRRIVIIGGTAEVDRLVLDRVKEAARSFTGQVEFEFWNKRAMAEMRQSVTSLPPKTVLLFSRMYRDGAGQPFIPALAAQELAGLANVPLYVLHDAQVGGGAVGGFVVDVGLLGKQAGELASRILSGAAPASLPFEIRTGGVAMFDWRALKRWGISESRLPPDSVVRFREPTIWEQYRWYIVGALAIIALQALLILGLLLHRMRRRQAEAELRESQEFMDISTRAGELGLWVRDLERGDMWANERLRSLFGFGQNDALRFDDFLARIHPDDRSHVDALLQQAQDAGLLFEADFRVLSNGTERWIAAKGQSVGTGPGRARRRMGALTDITARKAAELEAQRHRDELAHVSRFSMMGQLASALAHELNQPLGAILRNAEAAELFLQASPPDLQEVCAILADIRKDDQRAGAVIDRMRALLKRREFQWSELDLNALVEDVAGLLCIDAEARRVKLTLELALSAPPVRGDRVQLQQVLLNLILNAMDAVSGCEAGKRFVAVRVRPGGAWAEVAVSDTGYSIPEENFKRLFEPFFTTKPNGMGLGLAISHTIIEAHGGRLWAKNNPEAGATFCFTVPVAGNVEERGKRGEWGVEGRVSVSRGSGKSEE